MEKEELYFLKKVLEVLKNKLIEIKEKLENLTALKKEMAAFVSDNYYGVDKQESIVQNMYITEYEVNEEEYKLKQARLIRQLASPYFGRIDFKSRGTNTPYYIGLAHIAEAGQHLVIDWRAPLSSMYYDFAKGKAFYYADNKKITGEILKKCQYRIENGELKYMIESDQTISDEVLQFTLSRNSGLKMKEIVATIQKEQNQIIRMEENKSLIVQGVAGSGKTSIALHRASYMLYKHRDKLKSDDILIISPSNAFSSYISNVLPELGEANIMQLTFDKLARSELSGKQLETKGEQIDRIIASEKENPEISYKNSFEFLDNLRTFIGETLTQTFVPRDIKVAGGIISKEVLFDIYHNKFADRKISNRIDGILDYIFTELPIKEQDSDVKERVKQVLYSMFASADVEVIYKHFLMAIGLNQINSKRIGNENIAPLLYLKHQMYGLDFSEPVKYLMIDEMQEYSPVFYAMISEIFDCPKLIIGDVNQCIDKTLEEGYLQKLQRLAGGELVYLDKQYRSTKNIQEVADAILNIKTDKKFARSGEEVKFVKCNKGSLTGIKSAMKEYQKYSKVGIICKTTKDAEVLYESLNSKDVSLIEGREALPQTKYFVIPVSLSKGLEFDAVIVNDADENYSSELDKRMLYVATTRAVHDLSFVYSGKLSTLMHNVKQN